MRMNLKRTAALCALLLIIGSAAAAERTSPAAFYIAVDKSLSSASSGIFADIIRWLESDFLPSSLIPGDKVTILAFYGKTETVIDTTVSSPSDIETIRLQLKNISADGRFTDIGTAAETLREKISSDNYGLPVFSCICTDLLQEAPYTSPFAGTYYFPEYRLQTNSIITHRVNGRKKTNWYQISLPVEKNAHVAQNASKLYSIASAQKKR
jgi:hypothetical protein